MKKAFLLFISIMFVFVGCTPSYENDEEIIQDTDEEETETAIIPNYNISDEEYKVILPYKPGKARGVIVNQVFNRYDIDEMEEGLRRHSKSVFDPENYYFREGQYLSEDVVYRWLGRQKTDQEWEDYVKSHEDRGARVPLTKEQYQSGLNPTLEGDESKAESYRDNPRYISHILEQNYLQKTSENKVDLKGISIGLALKSVYQFETQIDGKPGPTYYEDISEEKMLAKGKEYAQIILERIREIEEAKNVPIVIALFREEEQSSLVPGNYVTKTVVEADSTSIGEWEPINEDYMLFPSDEAEEKYPNDATMMNDFTSEVRDFFPNFVGVIGKGFYTNNELQELKIEVPIEFHGKTEIVGFSQFAYGLMMETFTNQYDVEINVQSPEKQEALLEREVGEEEPNVYIYQ
ncbi:CamS family sex pheromone protein [Salinibacillus xinjiangensis]|uniref:CamS family sex pheromone protein n=1 Tax=Salinibacillus xinjiangensis TaxID=1229268 RepID=A0A6G1X9E4_9BACI|nr:CamS family sex pheromone protein [Salinibacillus xinjiangensis]MRG87408.1 CamS family sex pheromone protein [Salinibacillus xinjiangensis]